MNPYYQGKLATIYHGDCRGLSFRDISAIVTDPPYELGFMGKSWDSKGVSFQPETWQIIRNACKPGSPLLSFGGTRTFHRIACAIEDAGWEIRDTLMWVYGSGFPKSLDISKAIDKLGYENKRYTELSRELCIYLKDSRKALGLSTLEVAELGQFYGNVNHGGSVSNWENGTSLPIMQQWEKLKLILNLEDTRFIELIERAILKREEAEREVVAQGKSGKTAIWNEQGNMGNFNITTPTTPAAQLWEGYGTALKPAYEPIILAMNPLDGTFANNALNHGVAGLNIDRTRIGTIRGVPASLSRRKNTNCYGDYGGGHEKELNPNQGRFPANFIHDGSQMVLELFPEAGNRWKRNYGEEDYKGRQYKGGCFGGGGYLGNSTYADNGSAARFFYCAKASKAERGDNNGHPTVKPLALMEYLVKLVKMPEYNLIIDPFMGSGTTLLACIKLGIPCIGIDNDEHTCEIAARRCSQEVMDFTIPQYSEKTTPILEPCQR